MKYKLTATHGAVRAHRPGYLRSFVLRTKRLRAVAHRFRAGAISTLQNLTQHRPLEHKFLNHLTSRDSRVSVAVENLCSFPGRRLRFSHPTFLVHWMNEKIGYETDDQQACHHVQNRPIRARLVSAVRDLILAHVVHEHR